MMRLLFTGGGTGGHVYPALSVIDALRDLPQQSVTPNAIAWVGREDGIEREIVTQHGIPYFPIATGAVRGQGPGQLIGSAAGLGRGVRQGLKLLKDWDATAVFSTGGYVTVPLVLSAWLQRRPTLVYLPDMEPGLAIRFLAPFATRIAVSFDQVAGHFASRKVVVTGYPVRKELHEVVRSEARDRLGLNANDRVLMVLGGSSGAHSLNTAVAEHLSDLLRMAQVIHVCGPHDHQDLVDLSNGLDESLQPRYRLYSYLYQEMVDALGAADLVVARAGAATLAEFPAIGVPAVLVPYPHSGQHQRPNAEYLASGGAAVVLDDARVRDDLLATVEALFADASRLHAMAAAMKQLAMGKAADRLAAELMTLAGGYAHA